jgi:hypothetical protein
MSRVALLSVPSRRRRRRCPHFLSPRHCDLSAAMANLGLVNSQMKGYPCFSGSFSFNHPLL